MIRLKRKSIRWMSVLLATIFVLSASAGYAGPDGNYKKEAGTFPVETVRAEWFDADRDRIVPVKIYYPRGGVLPHPVVIYSHGLGSSCESAEYLGSHWASHGYVSVHLQHEGSDSAIWQGRGKIAALVAMMQAVGDPANARNRPLDVSFAIDMLEKLNGWEPTFRGKLDLTRIGVAGHSFGAWTALVVAGETVTGKDGKVYHFSDSRVKAVIPMSPPVPSGWTTTGYQDIKVPALHMTGTLDNSPIGETVAEARRIPFDRITGADQYLVTFRDGDHGIFSGRKRPRWRGMKDELFQGLIRMGTIAFLDAYLREDEDAMTWLSGGGFESVLGADGVFEKKLHSADPENP